MKWKAELEWKSRKAKSLLTTLYIGFHKISHCLPLGERVVRSFLPSIEGEKEWVVHLFSLHTPTTWCKALVSLCEFCRPRANI